MCTPTPLPGLCGLLLLLYIRNFQYVKIPPTHGFKRAQLSNPHHIPIMSPRDLIVSIITRLAKRLIIYEL